MYTLELKIYANRSLIGTAIYERLAEQYKLPSIQSLLVSISEEIEWNCDPGTQVYFLDNLREPNKRHLFQVRFQTNKEGHKFASCFLSVDEKLAHIHTITLQFPASGDRRCSSNVLSWLKELVKVHRETIEFEISGFGERATYRYICEHSLSAFVWNETIRRYLHVTDQIENVKEIKKGMMWKRKEDV